MTEISTDFLVSTAHPFKNESRSSKKKHKKKTKKTEPVTITQKNSKGSIFTTDRHELDNPYINTKFHAIPSFLLDGEDDYEDDLDNLLGTSPVWDEPKRLVGSPYIPSFHYKTVDDLIKDKVKQANRKMKEELKEEALWTSPSSSPSFSTSPLLHSKKQEKIDPEKYLNPDEDLTVLLKERLAEATETVNKAKEVFSNEELRQSLKDSKVPFGFEDIKEDEKGPFFDEIIEFLNPFMTELIDQKIEKKGGLEVVLKRIKEHFEKYSEEKKHLMKIMNVKRLIVPYISLDLSGDIILTYNKMEEDDPLVAVFRHHPIIGEEVFKFGVFLDRYDTNKEVICSLVWSTIDNMVICLPMVGLNPYPVCWNCEKSFGTMTCAKCGVAKYCSKECQVMSWKVNHRIRCSEINFYAEHHKCLAFE